MRQPAVIELVLEGAEGARRRRGLRKASFGWAAVLPRGGGESPAWLTEREWKVGLLMCNVER